MGNSEGLIRKPANYGGYELMIAIADLDFNLERDGEL